MIHINRSRVLRRLVVAAGLLFVFMTARLSYSNDAPADDWKAPSRAARKQNPVPADADAIAAGKTLYVGNCLACHGAAGKGDGPAAIAINPPPKDLADPRVSSETDGELFWKISEGKKPMPAFKNSLSETDRWKAVDYIRTLAPPPASQPSTQPASGQ
jgi:mono/diheme cytochrome c family protein